MATSGVATPAVNNDLRPSCIPVMFDSRSFSHFFDPFLMPGWWGHEAACRRRRYTSPASNAVHTMRLKRRLLRLRWQALIPEDIGRFHIPYDRWD